MSEQAILNAIKAHLERQDAGWTFIMGREVLTARQMLAKLDVDAAFRTTMVRMVVELSIDILSRTPE